MPDAFEIIQNGKVLDYLHSEEIDLQKISKFFTKKGYHVIGFDQYIRHILLRLRKSGDDRRENSEYFVKVARSAGISVMMEQDVSWSRQVLNLVSADGEYTVPEFVDSGKIDNIHSFTISKWRDLNLLVVCPPAHTTASEFSLSA